MRWVTLVLLLANGVFVSYQWYLHSRDVSFRPAAPVVKQQVGESLSLLSEQRDELKTRRTSVSRPPQERAVAIAGMCVYLGAFRAETSATALYQRLLALGVEGVVERVKIASDPDYWVYVQPLVSREEALRQIKEFQRQKIDSFVVTQGDMENAISLGLFTKKASAEKILNHMLSAGYDVKMKKIERYRNEFWVKVTDEQAKRVDDSVWSRVAKDYQYIEKEQNLCKPVASST